jgi:hypothetical protein
LEAGPLLPVHTNLDEVWVGPAAAELTTDARALDRRANSVGEQLRGVATELDRRAASIEAAEAAAAQAAVAADDLAAHGATSSTPPAAPPLPPTWH